MKRYESKIKPAKKPLILLVDSNLSKLRKIGNYLKSKNFDVAVVQEGKTALESAINIKPDLILLDLILSDMDGYEVCEILTSNANTKDIPIIFFSKESATENIIQGLQLGAVDFIHIEDGEAELLARINTHLKLKKYTEELEESNKQLKVLIEELNKLNEEKDEFLGIAAHDLKNPINNIALIAKILSSDDNLKIEDIKGFANDILISAERMLELIKNLLDINKIERGELVLKPISFDIIDTIKFIVSCYYEKAKDKNVQIQTELTNKSINILADPNAVAQILDNLLSNAIKYSPFDGQIIVKLTNHKDKVIISIKDEGPGFTDEDKSNLFKKFARLSAQPTAGENSTGLGLSIVKKLVDAINANISLISSQGEGANFIITIYKNIKGTKNE